MSDVEPTAHQTTQVVRITHVQANPGRLAALLPALRENAAAARAATGCCSADVCTEPDGEDRALVVSRWESADALRAFLAWHEQVAHSAIAVAAAQKPHSVHYPVAPEAD